MPEYKNSKCTQEQYKFSEINPLGDELLIWLSLQVVKYKMDIFKNFESRLLHLIDLSQPVNF